MVPTSYEGWGISLYQSKKVNNLYRKITENKANNTEDWYNKRMDEARFLRAYFYSEQFVKLGGLLFFLNPRTE